MNLQNQVKYLETLTDDGMFDGLTLPLPLHREPCINAIMIRCGLLIPHYSEPYVMRSAISQWSVRMQWAFTHLIQIIQAEYSPIENTDRYSEHTEERSGNAVRTHGGTDTRTETHSGTDTETETHSGTDTITNEVSAFNASTYQADRRESETHGETVTDTMQHGESITDAMQHGETITDEDGGTVKYTEHTHGNIGVTSNVTLINEELELLRHFDVYGWIAEKFEEDLCLMIY